MSTTETQLQAPAVPWPQAGPSSSGPLSSEDAIEQEEALWLATTYRGHDMAELTLRALVPGILLGVLIVAYNVYMGLRTGWGEGGSILAAIMGFAIMRGLGQKYTVLENNMTQTTASAAATVGNAMNVIATFFLLGIALSGWQVFTWLICMGFLGIFFAIPLRRQLVIGEKLVFPTGTACASLIQTMHSRGEEGTRKAVALLACGGIGAAVTWLRDAPPLSFLAIPPRVFFDWMRIRIAGFKTSELMLGIETSPMILGVGFLVGPRIGISLGLGAIVSWAVIAPWLATAGVIENLGYRSVAGWTMWVGSSVLVSAALTSLLIRWRGVARAMKSMGRARDHRLGALEIGSRTWLIGLVTSAAVIAVVLNVSLGVPLWMGLLSIPISFLLAVVVVRATGETDIAPLGASAHITQILYGGLAPGSVTANLGTAIVTAGSAGEAADLMQDLKTGYLLGATPRRQVIGQMIGVLVGALAAVPIFFLLTNAHGLGSEKLPAIAAVVWSSFASVLSRGFSALPQYALPGVAIGACIGIALAILEKTAVRKWMPSPVGFGVGMIFPGFQGITMMLGGGIRAAVDRLNPRWSEKYAYLVAAGLIAGEGLVGIGIAVLMERGVI
ncbi:MAG: OPT/YSL family transporter [Candidatus Eisenbacteria sp.]|nr:OPT/YSL family transporter [Candidatus Eisenbacteria bacterium]